MVTEGGDTGGGEASKRLREQRAAMADFGLFAFRSEDVDAVLQRACEIVAVHMDVKYVKVLELLPGGKEMLVRAGVGWKPGVVGKATLGAGEDSPAGHALLRHEAVISPDLTTETRFKVPRLLVEHDVKSMVNVVIAGETEPFGVLEVDAVRRRPFDDDDIAFLRNFANLIAAAVERIRFHGEIQATAKERGVLIRELAHRVKNLLGIVQSVAQQTAVEGPGAEEFREVFIGRVQALARAENLLFEDHGQEIELADLVSAFVEPFAANHPGALLLDEGPTIRLPARKGRILSLVLHELFTNAIKHGALSVPEGKVRLSWRIEGAEEERRVELRWTEERGPPVGPPRRRGFGVRLITSLATYELGGRAEPDYAAEGFRYRLDFPVNAE